MEVILENARRHPIGAACAAIFAIAFYVGPTAGMYFDIGWWALLAEPAMFAVIGILLGAINFVTYFDE